MSGNVNNPFIRTFKKISWSERMWMRDAKSCILFEIVLISVSMYSQCIQSIFIVLKAL